MEILNFLFGKNKKLDFTPNFQKSEYENWLDFLEKGGTSETWEKLKTEHNWHFPEKAAEIYDDSPNKEFAEKVSTIDRRSIPANIIDEMQKNEASEKFKNKIYRK